MSWTDERIEKLRKLWEEGHPASKIAEELGGVSRNAVIGKAHRLGLEKRPSPVKGEAAKKTAAKTKKAPSKKAKSARKDAKAEPQAEKKAAPSLQPAPPPKRPDPVVSFEEKRNIPLSQRTDIDQSDKPAPRIPIHDPRPAPKPAPPKPLRPARASEAVRDKTSLLDLNERICKWPIGHPGEPEFHFCGKKAEPGFPYCNAHCAVAYQAQQPRKDRPGRTPMPNLPRPR